MNVNIDNKNVLTKEGQAKLQAELKHLIEVERPNVIQEIKEARMQGDLSENAEYDAAREKQGMIETRIKEIETILANHKVITTTSTKNKAHLGSVVKIVNLKDKKELEVTIVGSLEANPFENKISIKSPLGHALLNVEKDAVVEVQTDKPYQIKVVDIRN